MNIFCRMAGVLLAASMMAPSAQAQDGDTAPEQDMAWFSAQTLALAQLKPADGWRWMPGGMMWRRTSGNGAGLHPTVNDIVSVHYAGTLVDGTEFDSSYKRGEPATFPLRQLIPAWQMAIPTMAIGDVIEIGVPADLGYGPRGGGPIPGGATLFFKIELVDIPSQ